jgi:guanylate kinase
MAAVPSIRFSVSATTRPPRAGEVDGRDYHFLSEEAFDRARKDGLLAESEEVYPGCWYGTLLSEINASDMDHPVLLDIDVQGASRIKQLHGDRVLTVFIRPPSLDVLERRLRARASDSDAAIRVRLDRAAHEMDWEDRFDVVIVNDELDTAAERLVAVVRDFLETCRRPA